MVPFGNITFNSTDAFDEVPLFIVVLMRGGSVCTIILNLIAFSCLLARKKCLPDVYWLQLTCLSFNDFIAGISVFIISFLDWEGFSSSVRVCSSTMAFFISSQAATLCNIAATCVYRLRTIRRINRNETVWSYTHAVCFTATVWITSVAVCCLPFAIWAKSEAEFSNDGCSMETVFGRNLPYAMKILVSTFLLPLISINILYGILFLVLRKRWKTTIPATTSETKQTKNTVCRLHALHGSSAYLNFSTVNPKVRIMHVKAGPSSDVDDTHSENSTPSAIQIPCTNVKSSKQFSRTQKNAYVLLGLILVFLNVFTWPGISVLIMESMSESWSLTRSAKFPLFTLVSCNSLVNPIIYTLMVSEFKQLLIEISLTLYRCCKRFFLCQNEAHFNVAART